MIKLSEYSTKPPEDYNKKKIRKETEKICREIAELQELLMANKKHSLLIVFQGMDSSGKGGSTRETFKYCSPSGVKVKAYKKPTDEEFAHDFLWRVHKHAPQKGMIQVFDRSHYEDVLIHRVHGWIDEEHCDKRIAAINAFEELLGYDNNTTVLKFYMHLSKDRQTEKLKERITDPTKNWKHNDGDWEEAKLWDKYREAYENVINKSSIPWIIAPVDSRTYRNYFIAQHVRDTLKSFKEEYPLIKESKYAG